ncbi:uncharacterized protein METZ01_LOCUS12098, partial [marine metagenome]
VKLLRGSTFADRLSKFSQFFSQPGDGSREPAFTITKAVSLFHELLQFRQVHDLTLGSETRVNGHSTVQRETVGECPRASVQF